MSFNVILLVVGVAVAVAYFAKRNHRRQKELKMQAKRLHSR